jgi:hypothetical protein
MSGDDLICTSYVTIFHVHQIYSFLIMLNSVVVNSTKLCHASGPFGHL